MAVSATAVSAVSDVTVIDPTLPRKKKRGRFITNWKTATGLIVIGLYVLVAVIGTWISPYDPSKRGKELLAAPSARHWFGTTHLGQDIFSQVLVGTRSVVYVGLLAGVVAVILSVLVGVTAGYLSGAAGEGMSAVSNVFLVIPALPLIIIITAVLSQSSGSDNGISDTTIGLIIGLTSWAWGARVLRAQTLTLRARDYVEAARATGERTWRIIVFELLPNLTAVIVSGFISTVLYAVGTEITLAFIGVSSRTEWNWGTILYWAGSQQALDQNAWWWFVPAGLAIALLGTALSLLNFGIDEFVNPRLRDSGGHSISTRHGKVRMRVGFTPVIRDEDLRSRTPEPRAATLTLDAESLPAESLHAKEAAE